MADKFRLTSYCVLVIASRSTLTSSMFQTRPACLNGLDGKTGAGQIGWRMGKGLLPGRPDDELLPVHPRA